MNIKNVNIVDDRKLEFLNRLFIERIYPDDTTPGIKKNLSGLSYRLAWLLSQELDFDNPGKLPAIKTMAEKLSTTTASIHDSLAQLEMAGIIIRSTETSDIHYADEDTQLERAQQFSGYVKKEIKTKSFKDYFRLNFFCNMKKDDAILYNINTALEILLSVPFVFELLKSERNYKEKIYDQLVDLNIISDELKGSKEETYNYISGFIEDYMLRAATNR